ncbi:MAG TPA: hypothetical protein VKU91_02725, partial [Acidimicrobiales bacterium]|nr:hypothetical protein [Acidimicrobiales bacterium]
NVDAGFHTAAADWEVLLRAQLVSPVRWYQSVRRLAGGAGDAASGEDLFVELGPGGSLSAMIRRTVPGASTVMVAVPGDLDRLVDAVAGDPALHAMAAADHGEHLYVSERMVVTPVAGLFSPVESARPGAAVEVGTAVGTVSGQQVRSPFAGTLMGVLAHAGERVKVGQPVAWLRADGS